MVLKDVTVENVLKNCRKELLRMNKQEIENLIEYVKDHSNNFLGSKATLQEKETFEYMYDLLIETLEKQLTNGWIPVSERLPKPKEYSEVWITNINECVSHAYFSDGNFRFDNYGGKAIVREWIIAWKPYATPEPYKEDKDAEKVDWSKVPVDTPIWVWEDGCEGIKIKRHFAKFEDGKIYVWNDGKTSWTVEKDKWSVEKDNHVSKWDNAELAEEKIWDTSW
jgi:hypothetical protein